MKVIPITDRPSIFLELSEIFLQKEDGTYQSLEIEKVRLSRDFVILKLKDYNSIDSAELLKGKDLSVEKKDVLPLGENEYFVWELIGLKAVDEEGSEIGRVIDVYSMPSHDLYLIKGEGKQFFIPAVHEFVKEVNIAAGYMKVRLIEGIIEAQQ